MVVVDGPEGRQVVGLHGDEEVLPPAALQAHEARQALLGVGAHHLQTVRHIGLVKNPSEERPAVKTDGFWHAQFQNHHGPNLHRTIRALEGVKASRNEDMC